MSKQSKVFYTGRKELMKCGQYAEILEYVDSTSIRVKFDDGYECTAWPEQFKRGEIKNPNIKTGIYIGLSKKAHNGLKMAVVEKEGRRVKVRFEDGYNKWITISSWTSGHVAHPSRLQKGRSKYIGKCITRDNHLATCVGVQGTKLLVSFDTGEEKWISMSAFSDNRFLFPHQDRGAITANSRKESAKHKFIGEKSTNKNGLEMTIVNYVDANNITVEFTASKYRVQTTRQSFMNGSVEDKSETINKYLAISKMQKCGLIAKVVEYIPQCKDPNNATPAQYVIEFEDGTRIVNRGMHEFLHGVLRHPKRPMQSGSMIGSIRITKKMFNLGDEPQLLCRCTNCGWEDIASFDEIYAHKCTNNF